MNKDVTAVSTLDCKNFVAGLREEFAYRSVNIVTNWRGGAPVAIHLNNVLPNSTLTLLKYQTYTDAPPDVITLYDDWDTRKKVTLFIDDMCETGESSAGCVAWLKRIKEVTEVDERYIVSKNYAKNASIFVSKAMKVTFPWEV